MIKFRLSAFLIIGFILITSCSSQRYDPNYWHQNFLYRLQKYLGHSFDEVRSGQVGGWGTDEQLVDQMKLPSGNIAYKYRYLRTCRYIFLVDPKTSTVAEVKWEGEKRDCIVVP
jgi:hypothetical protein